MATRSTPACSGLLKLPTACTLTAWELGGQWTVSRVPSWWSCGLTATNNFPPDVADIGRLRKVETPTLTAQVKNRNTNLNAGLGYALDAGELADLDGHAGH